MALDTLSATLLSQVTASGSKTQTGLSSGLGSNNTASKSQTFLKTLGNAVALGADECYFLLLSIVASGTATIDLSSFTDLAGQTVSLVGGKLKGWRFHLLGTLDTAPDGSTNGTACSGVAVGNAGANPHALNLSVGTTTQTVNNGSVLHYGDGGTAGFTVDATHKNILFTNLDGAVAAKLLVTLVGCTT